MEKKNFVIVALCVAIGVMAIAYAAFTTTLNVNGTVQATGTFGVSITDGSCTGYAAGADTPTGTVEPVTGATSATVTASLYTPGDSVSCVINVKNIGNLKAKMLSYSVVDSSGNTIGEDTTPISVFVVDTSSVRNLAANEENQMMFVIQYNWEGKEQPDKTSTEFTITLPYTQDI